MLIGIVISDYHHYLGGKGGRVFIKELHDSHACNEYNGSTIYTIMHEQKTSA